jgi:hypothetical protein
MGLDLDEAIDAVVRVGAAGRPDARIRPMPRPTHPARDVPRSHDGAHAQVQGDCSSPHTCAGPIHRCPAATRDDRRALRIDPEEKTWLLSPE